VIILLGTAQDAFGPVLAVVVVVSFIIALISFAGSRKAYDQIGRGIFSINEDGESTGASPARPTPAVSGAEREAEIRQMLTARNVRRERRGQAPLDVEAEMQTLLKPVADPQLAGEVRQMVVARNARRERQGKPPLDVEAEVARQLSDLA
jgi:hypothetical protein